VFVHEGANAIWSLKRLTCLPFSILVYFSLSKTFNYIAKDVSIFHFKLGNNRRPSYFHPFKTHPPSSQLAYYKPLVVEMESFWHLVCTYSTPFKLSLIFNTYVHFLNMWCVFINKALEGFDDSTITLPSFESYHLMSLKARLFGSIQIHH